MRKNTYEEVKKYIELFEYELLSKEYINSYTKLLIRCPKGHEYNVSFNSFKQGHRCSYCCGNTKRTFKEVKEYIENFNYTLLSNEYKNNTFKLLLNCPLGHEFKMSFNCFQRGQRCPICMRKIANDKHRLSYNEVKEYIESFNYELLSEEYIDNQTKLLVKCPNNHKFNVRYANFQQGSRCPHCKISKGEQRIMNWLDENNIEYIYNKPYFEDLLSEKGNLLRPDFIIEDKKIWIEYDGEVHYHLGYFNYTLLDLMNRKYKDNLKNKYAIDNNWILIRIPYWDFDKIENILEAIE